MHTAEAKGYCRYQCRGSCRGRGYGGRTERTCSRGTGLKENSLGNRHPNLCFSQSSIQAWQIKFPCCSALFFFCAPLASVDLDVTGIHRNNRELSIRVPGCYVTAAPLDNNWEETVAHSGEESDGGKDKKREAPGWECKEAPHKKPSQKPRDRFRRSGWGQTPTDAVNVKSGFYHTVLKAGLAEGLQSIAWLFCVLQASSVIIEVMTCSERVQVHVASGSNSKNESLQ